MRIVLIWLTLVACQPMYGDKPARLHTPDPRAHAIAVEPVVPIAYVEDCTVDFHRAPTVVHRDSPVADHLVDAGDTAIASADKAGDNAAKVELIKQSIDHYRTALVRDPYNAHATLRLALAYDRVLRKGCALALLKRLETLAEHPTFRAKAQPEVDQVADNTQWFRGYRTAALAAIGH